MFTKAVKWTAVDVTQGLLPGVYVATVENAEGTFFYGPDRAYFIHDINTGTYYLRQGGFWVPKTQAGAPRLFYIVNSNLVTATSLESAIEANVTHARAPDPSLPMQPTNMAEGAGYGIGMGIVGAIAASEEGRTVLVPPESDNGFADKLASVIRAIQTSETSAAPR